MSDIFNISINFQQKPYLVVNSQFMRLFDRKVNHPKFLFFVMIMLALRNSFQFSTFDLYSLDAQLFPLCISIETQLNATFL